MRTNIKLTLRGVLLALALGWQAPPARGQVEAVQREFQARQALVAHSYVTWPSCPCGTPAPPFPPDGFYGELQGNPALAAALVQNLSSLFFSGFVANFLRTNNIEGMNLTAALQTYQNSDFSPMVGGIDMSVTSNINGINWKDCLTTLRGYIEKLNYVEMGAAIDPTGLHGGNDQATADNLGWWNAQPTCADAIALTTSLDTFSGAGGQLIYVEESTSYATNAYTTNDYYAWEEHQEGVISVSIGFPCSFSIFLTVVPNANGAGATVPPVTADGYYHDFYSGSFDTNWGTYTSAPLNTNAPIITCGDNDAGWLMNDYVGAGIWPVVVIAPVWNTTADNQVSCAAGGCTSVCSSANALLAGSTSAQTDGGAMSLRISLGPNGHNLPAGNLYLSATTPSAALYSAGSMNFSTTSEPLGAGATMGALSGGGLTLPNLQLNVTTTNDGYAMYFVPMPAGTLGSLVTVQSNGTNLNQMIVTEVIGSTGTPRVMQFNYSPSTTNWTLVQGAGLINESRASVWTSPSNLTDTIVVSNASSTVATQTTNYYVMEAWGQTLEQQTLGTGSAAKTTTWTYYHAGDGVNNEGQFKQVVYPTGNWKRYGYDFAGRLTNEVSALGDNAITTSDGSNRQTQTLFNDTTGVVTTIKLLAGTEIGRAYQINSVNTTTGVEEIETITATVAGALVGASSNLTNLVWRATAADGATNAWDTMSVSNADGTMSIYSYYGGRGSSERAVVVDTGLPNTGGTAIVNGTETMTATGYYDQLLSNEVTDIATGAALTLDTYSYTDNLYRSYTVTHLDGTTEAAAYACCGLNTTTDQDGVVTEYTYDAAKRQVASERLNITLTNALDASGKTVERWRIGTNGNTIELSGSAYDNSGTLSWATNALLGLTSYSQATNSAGETVYTVTNPDGGTTVTSNYVDGLVEGIGGTAAHGTRYLYGADGSGSYQITMKLTSSGGTNEWTRSYTDVGGRPTLTDYADSSSSQNYYNTLGQRSKSVDQDGVTTMYQYGAKGEQTVTAVDMNANGLIDFGGTDQIRLTTNDVVNDHGVTTYVRRSRSYVWSAASSPASNEVTMSETSADGRTNWQTRYGPSTVTSQNSTVYNGAYRTNTATAEDGSSVVTLYTNGVRKSVTLYDSGGSQLGATTYTYDQHGRVATAVDARNGTTTYAYNNADQVSSVTTPPPSGSGSGLTTTTYYNTMLQPTNVVYPDSTKLTNFYALDGQVRQTSGSRAYAVGYGFDGQGRKTTMTNWTSFPSSGAEVTTWNYDQYRGWLTSKLDNSSHGPTYTYTYAGRLASRAWARGTNTSYAYTAAGQQATVIYNDSVTPGVTNTYDRLGRLSTAFHGVTTTTLSYDSANDRLSETNSGGALSTLSITNGYDAYLRRTNNVVFGGGSVLAQTTNSYDAASRVAVVSDGTNTGTYSYLANSALVDHLTLAHSGTNMMTNQNTYDYVNRLTGKNSVLVFDYQYNTAGQRTKLTLIDGSYWLFTYDTLGQVTGGKKYFWDGTPVAGEQNTYTFDTIGNRTQAQAGGDQTGANLRVAGYTNNALNQITSRGVPGYVDVLGLSLATNYVTVNTTNAYQKWEYFREQMATNNTSAAQYVGINVAAQGQTSVSGNVFLPETPESYTYDLDGNLTQDGRWTYTWDGENRLVNQTSLSGAPTASKYELAFTYDYQGRRIQKLVSTYVSSAYVPQYTNLFVYDGWNLAAMVTSNNLLAASFVWGTDLSGGMQGAGGVGGLLVENIVGGGVHFPAFDGNGNVVALVSVTNGTVTANYEYGPFGELLRATGPAAKLNPFLFSTKFYDWESGFYYYGYRYYNPSTGRWPNRDPLQESGGLNAYCFIGNNSPNKTDVLGELSFTTDIGNPANDGQCGGAHWFRKLTPGSTEQTGYIIQEVTIDLHTYSCSGALIKSTHVHYFEAMRVDNGATQPDQFILGSRLAGGTGTYGSGTETGVATFYWLANLPPGWAPNAYSGSYPASPTLPPLFSGLSKGNTVSGTLYENWNCCCSKGTQFWAVPESQ